MYKMEIVKISIHAPAKGATMLPKKTVRSGGISIHAPAKGATTKSAKIAIFQIFQSTLPRRERLQKPHISLKILISAYATPTNLVIAFFTLLQILQTSTTFHGANPSAISCLLTVRTKLMHDIFIISSIITRAIYKQLTS